jgi:hypothetical protein
VPRNFPRGGGGLLWGGCVGPSPRIGRYAELGTASRLAMHRRGSELFENIAERRKRHVPARQRVARLLMPVAQRGTASRLAMHRRGSEPSESIAERRKLATA